MFNKILILKIFVIGKPKQEVQVKRGRGRPKGSKATNNPAKKKRPSEIDVEDILKGDAWPICYYTKEKQGRLKLHHFQNLYEYHFDSKGVKYYRCAKHATLNCKARIITFEKKIYDVDMIHNHDDHFAPTADAGAERRVSDITVLSNVAVRPQVPNIGSIIQAQRSNPIALMPIVARPSLKEIMSKKLKATLEGQNLS